MAADAVGLLDALGIDRAHIVGASMGGMIAQIVAARHPDRTLSLTSVMSSSGNPALPRASDAALVLLAAPRPEPDDEAAIVDRVVLGAETLGSPGYPVDRAVRRAAAIEDYRRGYYPAGIARQTAAIVASGDRRALLATITAPSLVIHGDAGPLVPVEAGRDTAAHIAGERMIELPGMGHDLAALVMPMQEEVERTGAANFLHRIGAKDTDMTAIRLVVWAIRGMTMGRIFIARRDEMDESVALLSRLIERAVPSGTFEELATLSRRRD